MKVELGKLVPAFSTTLAFRASTPTGKVAKAARGRESVLAYMAGELKIRPIDQTLMAASAELIGDGDFSMSCFLRPRSDGTSEMRNYCFIKGSNDYSDSMDQPGTEKIKGLNFSQWMGAEAVRVGYLDGDGTVQNIVISWENLIRRVANTLGGSHPEITAEPGEKVNRLDPAVRALLKHRLAHLPIPYFLLLKAAQDILEHAPKLLAK